MSTRGQKQDAETSHTHAISVAAKTQKRREDDEEEEEVEQETKQQTGDRLAPLSVDFPSGFKGAGVRGRRSSVSAESDRPATSSYVKKTIPKSAEAMSRIKAACAKSILFMGLDKEQQQEIFDAMEEIKVQPGDEVIKQNETGDYFYVIDAGKYDVFKRHKPTDEPQKVFDYNETGSFGELALMYNCPRAATVKATTPGVLWRVDRETFRHIIIDSTAKKRKLFEEFLETVPILSNLTKQERCQVADCLETVHFKKGDYIIKQGDEGDKVFFIIEGGAIATQVRGDSEVEVGRMESGQYFGERSLITKEPRAANVISQVDMTCAVMDKSAFERLLGDCKDIMKRQIALYKKAD